MGSFTSSRATLTVGNRPVATAARVAARMMQDCEVGAEQVEHRTTVREPPVRCLAAGSGRGLVRRHARVAQRRVRSSDDGSGPIPTTEHQTVTRVPRDLPASGATVDVRFQRRFQARLWTSAMPQFIPNPPYGSRRGLRRRRGAVSRSCRCAVAAVAVASHGMAAMTDTSMDRPMAC